MSQPDQNNNINATPTEAAFESERQERELSVSDMLQSLYLYKKWIALFTVFCLLASSVFAFVRWLGVKDIERYTCTSSFSVIWDQNGVVLNPDDPSQIIDIQSAEHIVGAVLFLIDSETMAAHVREVTGMDMTRSQLKAALTASQHEETQMVNLSIVWNGSSETTMQILNAVLDCLPTLMNETMKNGSIKILDHANASERVPILPNFKLVLLATLAGLVAGCGGAVVLGLFRTTVQTRANIQSNFGMETLGEIPKVRDDMIILNDNESKTSFKYREAYRTMMSILRHRMLTERIQSVYITSTMAHEGKSSVILNVAQNFAEQEGYRVLLVDYDTRKPRIAHLLHIKPMGRTVHGVVNNQIALKDAIIQVTPNLHVLCADTSGFVSLNDEIIEQFNLLRQEYDFLFFDTPPVGIVSDALRLNECTDACIYAIKHNYVTTDIIRKGMHVLHQASHPIMGAVLNEVKENPLSQYYYESHYRHYGYYSYDKSSEDGEETSRTHHRRSKRRATRRVR